MFDIATIDALLARFAAIPENIAKLVDNRYEGALQVRSGEEEWSVAEIFAHMRAVDDIFTPRIYAILVRDHSPLAAYDERHWAEVARYAQVEFAMSLQLFTLRRAELVNILRRAEPTNWQHVGIHEEWGPVTLHAMLASFVVHEEEHYEQVVVAYTP